MWSNRRRSDTADCEQHGGTPHDECAAVHKRCIGAVLAPAMLRARASSATPGPPSPCPQGPWSWPRSGSTEQIAACWCSSGRCACSARFMLIALKVRCAAERANFPTDLYMAEVHPRPGRDVACRSVMYWMTALAGDFQKEVACRASGHNGTDLMTDMSSLCKHVHQGVSRLLQGNLAGRMCKRATTDCWR